MTPTESQPRPASAGSPTPPGPAPPAPRQQRGEGLARWMRLARRRDFQRVFRAGARARGSYFTVVAAHNPEGETRLGLSIGKRAFRRAVERNRLRRLVREAFRLEYQALPAGLDLVVVGSEPGARPDLDQARRELRRQAERAERRLAEAKPRAGPGRTGGSAPKSAPGSAAP